jgi:hypothetical protein
MPPIRSEERQVSIQRDGRIEIASQALKNKFFTSTSAATYVYIGQRSTLRDRIKRSNPLAVTRAHNYKISIFAKDTLT